LSRVERFFRSTKAVDVEVRPVFLWTDPRVRPQEFLCILAYYLQWNMRRMLAPMLFDDHDRAAGEALQDFPVVKTQPSPAANELGDAMTVGEILVVADAMEAVGQHVDREPEDELVGARVIAFACRGGDSPSNGS
jgi:hypothetical protein